MNLEIILTRFVSFTSFPFSGFFEAFDPSSMSTTNQYNDVECDIDMGQKMVSPVFNTQISKPLGNGVWCSPFQ
jgi:hypothetical protein